MIYNQVVESVNIPERLLRLSRNSGEDKEIFKTDVFIEVKKIKIKRAASVIITFFFSWNLLEKNSGRVIELFARIL